MRIASSTDANGCVRFVGPVEDACLDGVVDERVHVDRTLSYIQPERGIVASGAVD